MGKNSSCNKELKEIDERNAAVPGFQETPITEDCVIHRFLRKDHWDEEHDTWAPETFKDPLFSFVVQKGSAFTELSQEEVIREFTSLRTRLPQLQLVGAVKLTAAPFIGKNKLRHDPNPVLNKNISQHPNHGQAICGKEHLFVKELAELAEWSIHPSEYLVSLEFKSDE